jgi:hypothetical protein
LLGLLFVILSSRLGVGGGEQGALVGTMEVAARIAAVAHLDLRGSLVLRVSRAVLEVTGIKDQSPLIEDPRTLYRLLYQAVRNIAASVPELKRAERTIRQLLTVLPI